MIRKVVQVRRLDDGSEIRRNLEYWLSRPPEERVAAVDELRRQWYGDSQRLQKVARIMTLEKFTTSKEATGRGKGTADIEALGES